MKKGECLAAEPGSEIRLSFRQWWGNLTSYRALRIL